MTTAERFNAACPDGLTGFLTRKGAGKKRNRSREKELLSIYCFGRVCFYCGGKVENFDHFMPKALFGSNHWINLVPSCRNCNTAKGSREPIDSELRKYLMCKNRIAYLLTIFNNEGGRRKGSSRAIYHAQRIAAGIEITAPLPSLPQSAPVLDDGQPPDDSACSP